MVVATGTITIRPIRVFHAVRNEDGSGSFRLELKTIGYKQEETTIYKAV